MADVDERIFSGAAGYLSIENRMCFEYLGNVRVDNQVFTVRPLLYAEALGLYLVRSFVPPTIPDFET